jgi:hypothetical protein
MKFTSKSLLQALACTVVTLGAASLVYAAATPNIDVSGTWTWSGGGMRRGGPGGPGAGGGGGGGARGGARGGGTNVLVLKADVSTGTVTGTLTMAGFGGMRRGGGAGAGGGGGGGAAPTPTDIKNGKIAGNLLTFEVTRAGFGGGADMTIKYSGTVSNAVTPWTITGTQTMPGRDGGEPMAMPWTATKQATP